MRYLVCLSWCHCRVLYFTIGFTLVSYWESTVRSLTVHANVLDALAELDLRWRFCITFGAANCQASVLAILLVVERAVRTGALDVATYQHFILCDGRWGRFRNGFQLLSSGSLRISHGCHRGSRDAVAGA